MFYFPDNLNSQIMEHSCDVADQVLIPMFDHLGIKPTIIDDDGNETNTDAYQDVFEGVYDYINGALHNAYRGVKHNPSPTLPFPGDIPLSMGTKAQEVVESQIKAFIPNCGMYFGEWSEPVFKVWKSMPKDAVSSWIELEKNERAFTRQYGRVALRALNDFLSDDGIHSMYDLSTAHLPETEPDFGDLRFEQYEYGYVVWVVSEDLLDDGDVPTWLYPIMEQAIYNECLLIKFDADAPVVSHFDTYEWEV